MANTITTGKPISMAIMASTISRMHGINIVRISVDIIGRIAITRAIMATVDTAKKGITGATTTGMDRVTTVLTTRHIRVVIGRTVTLSRK